MVTFDDLDPGRFETRHAVAMLFHLPLAAILAWMMFEASRAGAFNIVWLFFSFFVFVPTVWIAGDCMQPWLDGANRSVLFRIVLLADCAISLMPMLILGWLLLAWALGSWPQFFRIPFQLYSLTTFFETVGGVLAGVLVCGLYSWSAARIIFLLLFRSGVVSSRDVLGDKLGRPPPSPRPTKRRAPINAPSSAPAPSQATPAARASPKPRPPSFREVQARVGELQGIVFPGPPEHRERAMRIGWPMLEWMLRRGHDPSLGVHATIPACFAAAHLAATLSADEARMAAIVLRSFVGDRRVREISARGYEGDPDGLAEARARQSTVGDAASAALGELLRLHPAAVNHAGERPTGP